MPFRSLLQNLQQLNIYIASGICLHKKRVFFFLLQPIFSSVCTFSIEFSSFVDNASQGKICQKKQQKQNFLKLSSENCNENMAVGKKWRTEWMHMPIAGPKPEFKPEI